MEEDTRQLFVFPLSKEACEASVLLLCVSVCVCVCVCVRVFLCVCVYVFVNCIPEVRFQLLPRAFEIGANFTSNP